MSVWFSGSARYVYSCSPPYLSAGQLAGHLSVYWAADLATYLSTTGGGFFLAQPDLYIFLLLPSIFLAGCPLAAPQSFLAGSHLAALWLMPDIMYNA